MKTTILILAVIVPQLIFAQMKATIVDPVSTYSPLPMELIQQQMQYRQGVIDKNKEYLKNLITWVLDLKTKTTDKDFNDRMDLYNENLKRLFDNDLFTINSTLYQFEISIKEDIEKYNKRIADEKEAEIEKYNKKMEEENNPEKYFNTGVDKFKNKDIVNAISDFSKAISLNSNYIGAYYYRGYCFYLQNNFNSSISDFSKVIELNPDLPDAYEYRGWCYNKTDKYTEAIVDFNKVIELMPNKFNGYFGRGYAKSNLGDYLDGNLDYNTTIERAPSHSMAYNNKGWNKFELKDLQGALKDVSKSIELNPDNYIAWDSHAEINLNLNKINECISDCNKALELNPKISNVYFIRGRAYFRLKNKTKACEDWSKSGELGKNEAYDFIKKYCK